ncbi:hypothetical protein [Streptomyces sp. NPDC102437]|uniref:hypothetical protein n=1 Tax=Streptomyces sp. NPDC102437 TaxID=3366175 RepID=UPI00380FCB82
MSGFSLNRLVRDVLESSSKTDPRNLADEVLDRVDGHDLRAALGQCLPAFVREEIRKKRNGGVPPLDRGELQLVMTEQPRGPGGASRRHASVRLARSAKVAAIRAAGPRWLDDRLCTGEHEWKRLGDCTFTDLMYAVRQRRDQAARTEAVAASLERLADLLRTHGVECVRDLPAEAINSVGGAAA